MDNDMIYEEVGNYTKFKSYALDYIKDFSEATLDSFEKIAKIFKLDLQIKESENE